MPTSSSIEMDNSQGMNSRKAEIRKIREHLKKATAKKSRLRRRTSSVVRRLHKSSLLHSHSNSEVSLQERALLYNNRKLAYSLETLRRENRLAKDQIVEINHQKLDLEMKQADLNCQLYQQKQKIVQQDNLISKLGCKFMEVAEILHSGYDDMNNESQHAFIDDNASISKVVLKKTSPIKTSADLFQTASVSNKDDDSTIAAKRRRPPRLSNQFNLSAITEAWDEPMNDESTCQSNLDPLKEPGMNAVLCQVNSEMFRRETFVIHESKQILDLPSPVKKMRSRIRTRRSDTGSLEPILRLSESPEKPVEKKEGTIVFPVDMELTSVQNFPIIRFQTDGSIVVNENELPLVNGKVIAKEADCNVQIKDNPIAVTPTVFSDSGTTCLEDENNHCIINFEKDTHMNGDNDNFKFVTERLSDKDGKRSVASAQSSSESAGFLGCLKVPKSASLKKDTASRPDYIFSQGKLDDNLPKKDVLEALGDGEQLEKKTQAEKCELMTVDEMETVEVETNPEDLPEMMNPDENQLSKKVKSTRKKQKHSATKVTSTLKNGENNLPVILSPSRVTGNLTLSKRPDSPCSNAENVLVQEPAAIPKAKKLSTKKHKQPSTGGEVGDTGRGIHYPHVPERSVLGEVSPNRFGPKPLDNFSSIGKPYVKNSQTGSEGTVQDLRGDVKPTGRSQRQRAPVTYKMPHINRKMRRE